MVALLQNWVTTHAEERPDAVAVVLGKERMTYGELEGLSNQLARTLRESGCARGDRICLLVPKSPAAIVGILGIYKADCIFVPLDTASPATRLAKIVESCDNRWILAGGLVTGMLEQLVRQVGNARSFSVGWLETEPRVGENFSSVFSLADVRACSRVPLDSANASRDPAHILFTSGSTGTPKGVVITHATVIHFVQWANKYFDMASADRNSCHSPLHFDLSTFDIFGTFAAGAELHLAPPELNLLPHKLADLIRDSELTQWFSVPSILNYMAKFDVVRFNDFPALRRLLWCGEVFPTPPLIYWMQRLPHVTFTNLYGPTEATIASSYYTVPECPADEKAEIPIGTPCDGEELLVLDERLQPLPAGEVGNLYIRGVGLSPGYWRAPEKTRGVFLPNPHSPDPADRIYRTGDLAKRGPDGLVYFIGRADWQIKSRGYRIELGEIETALNAMDCLQECAVVAIPTKGFEGNLICCAYVAFPNREVTPTMLRQNLGEVLPNYMLPSRWMGYEKLPKNVNGKIDRRKLKEEFQRHDAPIA